MNLKNYIKNNSLFVEVKPNSKKTEILGWNNEKAVLQIALKAKPEDNKANIELIKFISRLIKKKVILIRGKTSKKKLLKIE